MKIYSMHNIVVSSILPYVLSITLWTSSGPGRDWLFTYMYIMLARASLILSHNAVICGLGTRLHVCMHT